MKTQITRVVSVAAAAAMMFTNMGISRICAPYEATAAGTMTAFEITKNMQFGWNLGNTFDAYAKDLDGNLLYNCGLETETCWENPAVTKELIHAVKAKGFSTIRIPTTWFQHVDESNNFKISPEWLARVKEVVDWSLDEGLYVIINMHHEEGWQNSGTLGSDYNRIKPFVTSVWAQLAETFKDYDQHLVFEAMNEPRAVGTTYEWWAATAPQAECDVINKLNADIVKTIRGTSDANDVRLIMLPSYCASSDPTFIKANVIPEGDSYLAASVHAYTPYDFTMNDMIKDHSKFTAAWKSNLETTIETVKATFIDKNIPVVIGEMSASNYNNIEARCAWATTYATTAKACGIPCVLWDNNVIENKAQPGESHGYLDRSTNTWYPQSVALIDTFLDVFNDPTSQWGETAPKPVINHDDISTGTALYTGSKNLDMSKDNEAGGWMGSLALDVKDASQFKGKDLAIKYTGDGVGAAFSTATYGNWTELKPYDVDEEKGIAYVSMDDLLDTWGDDTSTVAHLSIKTYGVSTIETVALIKAAEHENTDKTKKYNLNLADRKDGESLVVVFEGAAGSAIEGAVGYADANAEGGWSQVTYKGTIGADGKYEFVVPFGADGIPAGVPNAQAQIWWCDDENGKMASYSFRGAEVTTTTTEATTTTTESTTTTTATTAAQPDNTKYGDANCDGNVTVADAAAILQNLGNKDKYPLSEQGEKNADCDGEKGLTTNDAVMIQKVTVALLPLEALGANK